MFESLKNSPFALFFFYPPCLSSFPFLHLSQMAVSRCHISASISVLDLYHYPFSDFFIFGISRKKSLGFLCKLHLCFCEIFSSLFCENFPHLLCQSFICFVMVSFFQALFIFSCSLVEQHQIFVILMLDRFIIAMACCGLFVFVICDQRLFGLNYECNSRISPKKKNTR